MIATQQHLTWEDLKERLESIRRTYPNAKAYGVPRGGTYVAALLGRPVDTPQEADIIVDDLVDSGTTRTRWQQWFPGKPFVPLYDKQVEKLGWLVFPWERHGTCDHSADDIVTRLLQYVGEDAGREGLKETPKRVLKAWKFWTSGYHQDPKDILKVFSDGGESYDQMLTVRDIPIFSQCEHHLAPFFGTATISYIPDGKIVGLSKLARLAEVFARRLQVQERLTEQIAEALWVNLQPKGVGVSIRCRHMCMESRGVQKIGTYTATTSLRGMIKDDAKARAEFLQQLQ